ncbi:hypothetical protein BJV77DRAFT_1151163 [Russula vinacea]|nr:hypothetical protein BJV77DRAFT_1151163 [Russula vinacea]
MFRARLAADDEHAGAVFTLGTAWLREGNSCTFRPWTDIAFLCKNCDGPIGLKGIQAAWDASCSRVDGIAVSNHHITLVPCIGTLALHHVRIYPGWRGELYTVTNVLCPQAQYSFFSFPTTSHIIVSQTNSECAANQIVVRDLRYLQSEARAKPSRGWRDQNIYHHYTRNAMHVDVEGARRGHARVCGGVLLVPGGYASHLVCALRACFEGDVKLRASRACVRVVEGEVVEDDVSVVGMNVDESEGEIMGVPTIEG